MGLHAKQQPEEEVLQENQHAVLSRGRDALQVSPGRERRSSFPSPAVPLGYGLGTSAASVLCDPCFQRCTWMLWASSPDMQLARCKNRSCSIWRAQREGPATLHCCKALPLIRQWPGKIWPHFNFYSYLCHIFFQGSMKNVTKVPQSIIFGIGRLWT